MKKLDLRPGAVFFFCLLYYICPNRLFWAIFALSLLHELGHIFMMTVFRIPILHIRIGAFGTVIETPQMVWVQELLCAIAGPSVNLIVFFVLRSYCLYAAVISLMLCLYNMLPIFPLDGGRALRALCAGLLPFQAAIWTEAIVSALTLGLIALLCVVLRFELGFLPLCLFALLLGHFCFDRNSCCDFLRLSI